MNDPFFDYRLPQELIAQHPPSRRQDSRLLVVDRQSGSLAHHAFNSLTAFLKPGDCLVLNDTRVVPARLLGKRAATGGKWEGLFLKETPDGLWELMSQTGGRLQPGEWVEVDPPPLRLQMLANLGEGIWRARPEPNRPALELLAQHGKIPLPPYIRKGLANPEDEERYQTLFARHPGAVAAPTAGLHFTPQLFSQLEQQGVRRAFVTLHVGPGTFRPLPESLPDNFLVEPEWAQVSEETASLIQQTKVAGGRLIAVGTTTTRVLETHAQRGQASPWQGLAGLTIRPGHRFQIIEALVTNFHLPHSSLLLLVDAFAGSDLMRQAYDEAIREKYRFYSYGDAMLIL
ncbi:MAG: tRNA preQ1(34) S-adenosylmethionine ribosyltransferase-isomerase QueA [Gemmataceae bacterium]|nr:tRNA preQ1(34) S-adenosylmethionine ribosyltransferase-isomerase QueA [Gemmataceae bacterium]